MKSKYCFIRNFGIMRPGSFVYHVVVGTSMREQTKFTIVHEFCEDTGVYFRRWSDDVDKALAFAANGWTSSFELISSPFRHVTINIETLYQLIIDDSFESFESKVPMTKSELYLRFLNDPAGIIHKSTPVSNTACPSSKRKNLSFDRLTDGGKFLVGSLFILLIFLADAYVEKVLQLVCGGI